MRFSQHFTVWGWALCASVRADPACVGSPVAGDFMCTAVTDTAACNKTYAKAAEGVAFQCKVAPNGQCITWGPQCNMPTAAGPVTNGVATASGYCVPGENRGQTQGCSDTMLPEYAFDNDPATYWDGTCDPSPTQYYNCPDFPNSWLMYTMPSVTKAASYSITTLADGCPATWELLGCAVHCSDDSAATWTTLDTQTNQACHDGTEQTYQIGEPGAYTHYKWVFTAGTHTSYKIPDIKLIGTAEPSANCGAVSFPKDNWYTQTNGFEGAKTAPQRVCIETWDRDDDKLKMGDGQGGNMPAGGQKWNTVTNTNLKTWVLQTAVDEGWSYIQPLVISNTYGGDAGDLQTPFPGDNSFCCHTGTGCSDDSNVRYFADHRRRSHKGVHRRRGIAAPTNEQDVKSCWDSILFRGNLTQDMEAVAVCGASSGDQAVATDDGVTNFENYLGPNGNDWTKTMGWGSYGLSVWKGTLKAGDYTKPNNALKCQGWPAAGQQGVGWGLFIKATR